MRFERAADLIGEPDRMKIIMKAGVAHKNTLES